MAISAKDVSTLRQMTGAGMMDCKRMLEETNGDMEAAAQLMRERGLAASAKRADRENAEGAVALIITDSVGAIVELKCETDFVAKSDQFKNLADDMANAVIAGDESSVSTQQGALDELKVTLKENIELGRVKRFAAAPGNVLDSYLHVQAGRGVNGVLVEIAGGTMEVAHDVAVHICFAKPEFLHRDEVPADRVAAERATLETITRNEGKPEAAIAKIVEGRIQGFFKDICLLDQPYAKDDKLSVAQFIGSATIVRFAQVVIGK